MTLGKIGQDLIRLWGRMTSLAQIPPKLLEIARHEKDHLCRSEKLNPLFH